MIDASALDGRRVLPLLYLLLLLVVLPWAAIRSAPRRGDDASELPPRRTLWLRTIVVQLLLLAIAWRTARAAGYEPFTLPSWNAGAVVAALAALLLCQGLAALARAIRSEEERRGLFVYSLVPRSPLEWLLWGTTVTVAAVAEEVAYRGVGMTLLRDRLDEPWTAAGVCALAFALAHWAQGAKSVAVIFVVGLVLQGLVALTGTLVFAMVVHAVHNVLVTLRMRRAIESGEVEPDARAAGLVAGPTARAR